MSLGGPKPETRNDVKQSIVPFGSVPAVYEELIDLGKDRVYEHIILANETDVDVIFKFEQVSEDSEMTLRGNREITLDDFPHWGTVKFKYVLGAPTTGSVHHYTW